MTAKKTYLALPMESQQKIQPVFRRIWEELPQKRPTEKESKAVEVLFGTMISSLTYSFGYLPEEEQVGIFALCDWAFRFGALWGRSPSLVVKLFDEAEPDLVEVDVPEWFELFLRGFDRGKGD